MEDASELKNSQSRHSRVTIAEGGFSEVLVSRSLHQSFLARVFSDNAISKHTIVYIAALMSLFV